MFSDSLSQNVHKQLFVWLIGQAKHYVKQSVGTKDIRELVGSVELAKRGAYASSQMPHTGLEIRQADPVCCILLTTGVLTSDSWALLRRSGVIGMDGEMIAAFLADKEAGQDGQGFELDTFVEWLGTGES